MASKSRSTLSCLGCLRASTQPVASSSRSVIVSAAPFSTSSSSYAAPTSEEATARKPPHTAAAEHPDPSSSINAIGRGRRSAGRGRPRMLPPFPEWMAGEAKHFKEPKPGIGPSWIGETPFPLNPAFNPPPPLRHSVKNEIWKLHISDPSQWTVPALSQKYSIGKERMEAVLRLKALETEWSSQNKALQTEFQANMDRLLGARDKRDAESRPVAQSSDNSKRGPQHEEFAESDAPNAASVIAPAVAESTALRRSMIAAIPSGGPATLNGKIGRTRSVQNVPTPKVKTSRPSISIANVPATSYEGAGRVASNVKKALKRVKARKASKAALALAKKERASQVIKKSTVTVTAAATPKVKSVKPVAATVKKASPVKTTKLASKASSKPVVRKPSVQPAVKKTTVKPVAKKA